MRQLTKAMSSGDKVAWTAAAVSLALMCYVTALNGMIDLGAASHDAICPDHGWAVSKS